MTTTYEWLKKRTLRSVDQLRLWSENPRLDPEESHVSIHDYVSDLITENGEKRSFLDLIASIGNTGFVPSDPVVVWKDLSNEKYYVAEGNRRVLALKLLRNPEKAPKSIRNHVRKYSELIKRDGIEKILVSVAPSFEECEWYITQRHAASSLQRPWSRLQHQRWIAELYDKYEGNIEKLTTTTLFSRSELNTTLRILKIRDMASEPTVLETLNEEEQDMVKSHRIPPMSILERWFGVPKLREKWGLEFDDDEVRIISNKESFLIAYATLIKLIINRNDPDVTIRVNTRTVPDDMDNILKILPEVSFDKNNEEKNKDNTEAKQTETSNEKEQQNSSGQKDSVSSKFISKGPKNKNPDRNQLIVPTCKLRSANFKLTALFDEFKKLPVYKYQNCVGASLRVFLDLAVADYLIAENCKDDMKKIYKRNFNEIPLKSRLEYLKQNKLTAKTPPFKVVEKLLNQSNEYSLDTLNNYIHGTDTHNTSRRFLNGFWDFLFPLFEKVLDIKDC